MMVPIAHAGVITDAPTLAVVVDRALTILLTISGTIGIIAIAVAGLLYLFAAHTGSVQLVDTARRAFFISLGGIAIIMGALIVIRFIARMIMATP